MIEDLRKTLLCGILTVGVAASAAPMQRPPESVRAGKVTTMDRMLSRKYIGTVSAVDDVALVARVSGVVLDQRFGNGDMVKKNQELFVLEDTTYVAARNSAEAKLAQSKAEYDFAKRNLARMRTLRETKATSESSYDEAVRLEATSKAVVMAAEAALLDAKNNLSYTRILSPINGKTGKAAVSPGNYVTPASGTLVTVVDLDRMYINFWMSMSDFLSMFGSYESLQKNAIIRITMSDGSTFPNPAKIVFMDNRVDKDTDTIRIRGEVETRNAVLLPDSIVTVYISRNDGPKCVVPVSAVMSNEKMTYVYVLDAQNKANVRPVVIGEIKGDRQFILSGLKPGETVIFDGTHKVMPGATVVPVLEGTEKK